MDFSIFFQTCWEETSPLQRRVSAGNQSGFWDRKRGEKKTCHLFLSSLIPPSLPVYTFLAKLSICLFPLAKEARYLCLWRVVLPPLPPGSPALPRRNPNRESPGSCRYVRIRVSFPWVCLRGSSMLVYSLRKVCATKHSCVRTVMCGGQQWHS